MEYRRGLAMRILSVRQSVRPFVCLSVKRVNCDKMEERSVQISIRYETFFTMPLMESNLVTPLQCELTQRVYIVPVMVCL